MRVLVMISFKEELYVVICMYDDVYIDVESNESSYIESDEDKDELDDYCVNYCVQIMSLRKKEELLKNIKIK